MQGSLHPDRQELPAPQEKAEPRMPAPRLFAAMLSAGLAALLSAGAMAQEPGRSTDTAAARDPAALKGVVELFTSQGCASCPRRMLRSST